MDEDLEQERVLRATGRIEQLRDLDRGQVGGPWFVTRPLDRRSGAGADGIARSTVCAVRMVHPAFDVERADLVEGEAATERTAAPLSG